MSMSDSNKQRTYDKFIETKEGKTAVRISPEATNGLVKFGPSDELPDYIGLNKDKDATDGATDWVIHKFTYNGSDEVTQIETAKGSWTGRAALF